jgi:MFS family permease
MVGALVALLIVSRIREDYRPAPGAGRRRWIPASLLPPGIAVGFVNVHYPVTTGFLILHLARHGNSGPASFTTYASTMLLSRFFLGRLPDRMPPAITFYGGLAGMALGLSVLAAGPPPFLAVTATAVLGFGFSFPWSSILATVLRKTPSSERGFTIGVLSAFYDLFVGGSSFLAGAVAEHFGYPAAFLMAAAALAGAAVAGRSVFAAAPAGSGAPEERYTEARP